MANIYNVMLDEVVSDIKALLAAGTLVFCDQAAVVKRKKPWDDTNIYDGITVSPGKEFELPGTNGCDDIAYPCIVTLIQGTVGNLDDIPKITLARQVIRKHFIHQRPTAAQIQTVKVKFGDIVLPKKFRDNYDAGTMALIATSREDRVNA